VLRPFLQILYYTEIQRRKIMAASRMVQARVPGDIQDIANQVIQASGLTVSDVVRVLMTRIAQDKVIPPMLFQPNAETLAAFAEIEQGGLKRFDSVDDLYADLHAED
jgi:DNA-damage-inducible protein J